MWYAHGAPHFDGSVFRADSPGFHWNGWCLQCMDLNWEGNQRMFYGDHMFSQWEMLGVLVYVKYPGSEIVLLKPMLSYCRAPKMHEAGHCGKQNTEPVSDT